MPSFSWIKQEDRMVKRTARHTVLFLVLYLLVEPLALAQAKATGSLTGTVTDEQGGVILRAIVSAKNVQTGSEFTAISNEVGVYAIPSVPGGSYTVSVNVQGFKTAVLRDIKVDAGSTVNVDAIMQIGLANEVIVTASKYEEEIVNAPASATVISEQAIQALPTQNIGDLLRAVPGVNVNQMSASSFGINTRAASKAYPPLSLH
jgi:outer membrane receptor for ferrienterochelin and colicins